MKDEIKEILDKLRSDDYYEKEYQKSVYYERDLKKLEDYITNLQEKVDQYENPDDMTLFYMWLDEKAKDKMKQLQEENKFAKEYEKQYRIAKSRNEKAIKKLKTLIPIFIMPNNMLIHGTEKAKTIEEALNILQGSDKDE